MKDPAFHGQIKKLREETREEFQGLRTEIQNLREGVGDGLEGDQMDAMASGFLGKRLTYADLTA